MVPAESSSPARRVARHTGWTLGAHALATVMLLVQAILLTRMLGATGFGTIALIVTYTLTVLQLLDSRIWEPAIKYIAQFRAAGRLDQASGALIFCSMLEGAAVLTAMLVVVVTAPLAATWLVHDAGAADLFRLYAWSVVLAGPNHLVGALLRLADRPGWLAAHRVVVAVVQLLGVVLVTIWAPTLSWYITALLVGHVVGALASVFMGAFAARSLELSLLRRGALRSLRGHYREIARFCLLTNLAGSSRIVRQRSVNLILGLLTTPAVVGIYDIARNITSQLLELFEPLQMSIFPEMATLAAQGRIAALRRLARQASLLLLAVVVPGCLVGTLLAPWIVPLAFGAEFAGSALLVQIMLWQLLWLPAIWIPGYLLVAGRVGLVTSLDWTITLVFIGMLVALIPPLGGVGAAIAATAHQVLFLGMCVWAFRRTVRKQEARPLVRGDEPVSRAA